MYCSGKLSLKANVASVLTIPKLYERVALHVRVLDSRILLR